MSKHTLFVCKSCHRSSAERPENPPFDGTILLDQLNFYALKNTQMMKLKFSLSDAYGRAVNAML
ncbi:hypothetical protein [Gloeocapsopsis dulcis]|uniref:hypothetical protein n=1 Tax=Gloeocapsopsis dulcis TaxID=2859516 RepID=UPI001F3597D1|nr:hypothetical protein [Gloeocapsopsis dulcis]WNN89732.1 hypothetical protein P0S91_01145 [Gloeocapsopsis dulcis]